MKRRIVGGVVIAYAVAYLAVSVFDRRWMSKMSTSASAVDTGIGAC